MKDLVQEKKKLPRNSSANFELLVPKTRIEDILNNHLAQIPITPNQQGTFELREKVLANAGAQDMDNSGYELADLEDIEFFWENPQVELDSVFRPGVDTPFPPTAFNNLERGEG